MKIIICGKGGSGKSTISALVSKAMVARGSGVLLVDGDESNLCLHRLIGADLPVDLMENLGGRAGAKQQLWSDPENPDKKGVFRPGMSIDDIPGDCIARANGVKLLVMGKIRRFGEGCACIIGGLSREVLSKLTEKDNEFVIIDAEAGLEHFGRRVESSCDLILCVIDPTFESFTMAANVKAMAAEVGIEVRFVLNKITDDIEAAMRAAVVEKDIIAAIPNSNAIFIGSLQGDPLAGDFPAINDICTFIENYKKPVTFKMA